MYVVQYELHPGNKLRTPPARSAASLNTHDMPTFRAFWEARDVAEIQRLGFFNEDQAREERERRAALRRQIFEELPPDERNESVVLRRLLEILASSPARMVLVNLEDLWGEAEPQNVPGTHTEVPNWRRKARLAFEEFSTKPEVLDALRRVDAVRKERG
jgi:4-alpha-glucanotransferase